MSLKRATSLGMSAEKKTLRFEDWWVDRDTLEDVPELEEPRSTATVTESSIFLNGAFEMMMVKTGDSLSDTIRVFNSEGDEIEDLSTLTSGPGFMNEGGEHVEVSRPAGDDSDSKYRELLDAKYQQIANQETGYVIFAGIDLQGYFAIALNQTDGVEYLRGAKWAYEFMGWGSDSNYGIDTLFLNGSKIENIPSHIASLTEKVTK